MLPKSTHLAPPVKDVVTTHQERHWAHERPLVLYKTRTGNYYLPSGIAKDVVINEMVKGKVYDSEIVKLAKRYVTKGSSVLDVGACFGQMSVIFSKLAGVHGEVLAFEADDYIFSILQKNIAANGCHNIHAFLEAVYDRDDATMCYAVPDFTRFDSYGSYGLDPNATSGRKVQTITIDGLDIRKPVSFMKVDAQGSDLFVLRGAVETIRRHQMPIVFEFEEQFHAEFGTSFEDYLSFIDSISYKIKKIVYGINYLIVPKSKSWWSSFFTSF